MIGAGAAGLAAALKLAEHSLRVLVVDGRGRSGGRVMWQSVGSSDVPAELGAEFIHGDAPETSAFLADAALTKVETGGPSFTFGADGMLRAEDGDDDFTSNTLFERARALPDESVAAFLRRFEADPALRTQAQRARAFVEGFEAADPERASVLSIADEIRSGVDETSYRPVGSYAPLFGFIDAACARAGVEFAYGSAAERIGWSRGRVEITMRGAGGATETLHAAHAIVTVPVGVLAQRGPATPLTFDPPLPSDKLTALRGLEMGHAVRVTLSFRSAFWETIAGGRFRDAAFFRAESGAYNAFWTQFPLRTRTIVAWGGGPRAAALANTPIDGRITVARDEFGILIGEPALTRAEFEAGVTHDWTADPFACGAYSYVVAGGGTARTALGAPVDGTLYFAGEATATDGQGGTVSGAFATGLRAAEEIIRGQH